MKRREFLNKSHLTILSNEWNKFLMGYTHWFSYFSNIYIYIYIYIVIHILIVSLYRNSSVRLDTSSWDRNAADFVSVGDLTPEPSPFSVWVKELLRITFYMYVIIILRVLNSWEELLRFTLSILTNPSARAGYDTRSIFKRSLTGLNSEFSFS